MRPAVKAFDDQRDVRFFIVELDPEEALRTMEAVNAALPRIGEITGVTLEVKEAMLVEGGLSGMAEDDLMVSLAKSLVEGEPGSISSLSSA